MAERRLSNRLPRSVYFLPVRGRQDAPHNQQLALFLHLARMLLRLARRIPWSRLCEDDEPAAVEAKGLLSDVIEAAERRPEK